MRRCPEDQADIWLDHHPQRFDSLREAVNTFRRLRSYKGIRWVNFRATVQRLHATATQMDKDWWEVQQRRYPALFGPAMDQTEPAWTPATSRRVEDLHLPESEDRVL